MNKYYTLLLFVGTITTLAASSEKTIKAIRPFESNQTVVGERVESFESILRALGTLQCTQEACCLTTLTAIIDLQNTITECCATTFTALVNIENTLTTCCNETFSLLAEITSCMPTAITTPTTITSAGFYCLAHDINGPIIIDANQVSVDLNNHTISNSTSGIIINENRQQIHIFNGRISNMSNQGVLVNEGCQQITLQDLELNFCGNSGTPFGIHYFGTDQNQINGVTTKNCTVYSCFSGIAFECVNQAETVNCSVKNSNATGNEFIGFWLRAVTTPASSHIIENCSVLDCLATDDDAYGILIENMQDIVCRGCSVLNLTAGRNCHAIGLLDADGVTIIGAALTSINSTELQSPAAVSGIESDNSANSIMQECQIIGIGNNMSNAQSDGVRINDSGMVILNNVIVDLVSSTTGTASGFTIMAPGSIIQDCSCANIISENIATGYFLITTSLNLDHCIASDISATTSAIGFNLIGVNQFNIVELTRCQVQNCEAVFCHGFIITNLIVQLDQCSSSFLISDTLSQGYFIDASNVVMNNCTANLQASFGFDSIGLGAHNSQLSITNYSASHMLGGHDAIGVQLNNAGAAMFNSLVAFSAAGNNADGYIVTGGGSVVFDHCTVKGLGSGGLITRGFHIQTNNSLLLNCAVEALDGAAIWGYLIEGFDNQASNCYAKNISNGNGTGFEIASGFDNVIKSCNSEGNFNGFVDNGTTSIICDCFAANNNGGANNYSVGIPNVVTPGSPTIVCGNTSA